MRTSETELELLLVQAFRVKAEQVPDVAEPFDPSIAMMPGDDDGPGRGRSRHLVAAAALVVLLLGVVGLVLAFRGDDGPVTSRPAEVPVAHLSIEALPTLTFQAKTYTTSPGLNEIDFTSAGGTHALAFDDPALAGFRLVAFDGSPSHGDVRLEAGRDYTIYCALPGHRQAGMEAVIHVTSEAPAGDSGPTAPSRS